MNQLPTAVYYPTQIHELDRVLNGGLILGKLLLLGVEAESIGASELLLQACDGFARDNRRALYVSGSMRTRALRAFGKRLGITTESVAVMGEPNIDSVLAEADAFSANLLVVDALQDMAATGASDKDSTWVADEIVNCLARHAQRRRCAVILVDNVYTRRDRSFATAKMCHLADGYLHLRPLPVRAGKSQIDTRVREIASGEKFRQGPSDARALIELTESGFRSRS